MAEAEAFAGTGGKNWWKEEPLSTPFFHYQSTASPSTTDAREKYTHIKIHPEVPALLSLTREFFCVAAKHKQQQHIKSLVSGSTPQRGEGGAC